MALFFYKKTRLDLFVFIMANSWTECYCDLKWFTKPMMQKNKAKELMQFLEDKELEDAYTLYY